MKQGDRVVVKAPIELFPFGTVAAGETGVVSDVAPGFGITWVRLDREHDWLSAWNNEIALGDEKRLEYPSLASHVCLSEGGTR